MRGTGHQGFGPGYRAPQGYCALRDVYPHDFPALMALMAANQFRPALVLRTLK